MGPTCIEVIEEYQPAFQPIRERIETAAKRLVNSPLVEEAAILGNIAPSLRYSGDDADHTNVVLLAATDFATPPESKLSFRDDYAFALLSDPLWLDPILAWTGDDNPLAKHLWDNDGSRIESRCQTAIKSLEYVMLGYVDRQVNLQESSILRGQIDIVRIDSGELVAQIPLRGPPITPLQEYPWRTLGEDAMASVKETLGDRAQIQSP